MIKYGWSTAKAPHRIPNLTARLQQQWTILVGDQLLSIQNPTQLLVTRSTERGMIVNMGNQIQVWKRILDLMDVTVPMGETAHALGWKVPKHNKRLLVSDGTTCAVLLALPPFTPRCLVDAITQVWFEDFGFSHVGFCVSTACASHGLERVYETACNVDMGWSSTTVVPTFRHKPVPSAIRRLPIGGRNLIQLWKYYATYRQWNLMDQDWIVKDIMEQTGYVAETLHKEMKVASRSTAGNRPFDREYVLPDYQTTFRGVVRLPPALQQAEKAEQEDEEDEEDDDDVKEEDMQQEEADDDDDVGGSDDDEPESHEQKRQRLLRQREEETRRRRAMEDEQQVLHVSTERFAVPEVLFRPSDAGLPAEWAGLAPTVNQAIQACPKYLQAAMYRSIYLTGGLSQLSGLKDRVYHEVRALAPSCMDVVVESSSRPVDDIWFGACKLADIASYRSWSISKEEWDGTGKRGAAQRLLVVHGGYLV